MKACGRFTHGNDPQQDSWADFAHISRPIAGGTRHSSSCPALRCQDDQCSASYSLVAWAAVAQRDSDQWETWSCDPITTSRACEHELRQETMDHHGAAFTREKHKFGRSSGHLKLSWRLLTLQVFKNLCTNSMRGPVVLLVR